MEKQQLQLKNGIILPEEQNHFNDICRQIMIEFWKEKYKSRKVMKYIICDVCARNLTSIEPFFTHFCIENK